jgi:hydroxymethylbilane synthase
VLDTRGIPDTQDAQKKLIIGTRGSKLALWQSEYIKELIQKSCDVQVEIKIIKTTGDKILDVPLAKIGEKGLFTKELEFELLGGSVDLCVHSMKDMPTQLPDGLVIAATPPRVDARDVIVSATKGGLKELPHGASVGTSSLRRRAQIAALRSDLILVDVRGNLDTRLRKAETGEVDAVVLASAGITRMGWEERITGYIPTEEMISAVGQGAIAVEIRENDAFMQEICAALNDADTMTCVTSERVVMSGLEGGCQVPIGAYARKENETLVMDAMVASVDGATLIREQLVGSPAEPEALGMAMVEALKARGAAEILEAVRAEAEAV